MIKIIEPTGREEADKPREIVAYSRDPADNSGSLTRLIPPRLRALRIARDLKLHEIALMMRTTPQTVQRLETGNMTMTLQWLDRFLYALAVPAEAIFGKYEPSELFSIATERAVEDMAIRLRRMADDLEEGRMK